MTTPPAQQLADLQRQAIAAFKAGQLDQAKNKLSQLAELEPDNPQHPFRLAEVAFVDGDRAQTLAQLRVAQDLAPDSAAIHREAGKLYRKLGASADALEAINRLIATDRKAIAPRADKAHLLQTLGRFEEAGAIFQRLLKDRPGDPELTRMWLVTKTLPKGHRIIREMMANWSSPRLTDPGRVQLGYALAKAMADQGDIAKEIAFLKVANATQAKLAPFDLQARRDEQAAVLKAQDGLGSAEGTTQGPRPVFVIGLPRSGTSLVEQILARHPKVTPGGELGHALRLAYGAFGPSTKMRALKDAPQEAISGFADKYLQLAQRDTGATDGVVTDKSIMNFMILGLLHAALPNARFIVLHRDPRAIALSMWRNFFATGTHRYTNDMGEMAEVIKLFRAAITHWRQTLPFGTLLELDYDRLVSDPGPQAASIIAAADLDWDEACLSPHLVEGEVRTLSLAQVRAPLHDGRREAWHAYEDMLAPFIEAWGDTPWD